MAVNQFNQSFNRGRGRNGNNRGRGNGRGNNNGQFSGGQSTQFPNGQSQFFGHSYNGQGQFLPSQSQSKSNFQQGQRPVCQICGKNGHTALDCYHRMNFAYQGRHPPAKACINCCKFNGCKLFL
ncbi:hypothetical protein SO802_034090 [Lithocarpus litseifolius]|uniref:CCHC-type domain-containing protein n=1 Tax=Lithocarpus litseifolius TaxID=425828 RepID=A0AAW2BI76_9ROSI